MKKIALLFIMLSFLMFGCGKSDVYESRHEFSNMRWERIEEGKAISFKGFQVKNLNQAYNIRVGIQHTSKVNPNKIRFLMEIITPSGIERSSVHEISLIDSEGNFIGEMLGDFWLVEELCKQQIFFSEEGEYTIVIKNFMHRKEAEGLVSMQVRIEKTEVLYNVE